MGIHCLYKKGAKYAKRLLHLKELNQKNKELKTILKKTDSIQDQIPLKVDI